MKLQRFSPIFKSLPNGCSDILGLVSLNIMQRPQYPSAQMRGSRPRCRKEGDADHASAEATFPAKSPRAQ